MKYIISLIVLILPLSICSMDPIYRRAGNVAINNECAHSIAFTYRSTLPENLGEYTTYHIDARDVQLIQFPCVTPSVTARVDGFKPITFLPTDLLIADLPLTVRMDNKNKINVFKGQELVATMSKL